MPRKRNTTSLVEKSNINDALLEKTKKVSLFGGKVLDKQDPMEQRPASKMFDPLFVLDYLQYKSKNVSWALSYQLLRKISYRNGVIASVINTRVNQISMFAHQYLSPADRIGYIVYPKRRKYQHLIKQADPNYKVQNVTHEEVETMREVMEFLENCGRFDTLQQDPQRDNFNGFLRKIVRDSLTFDQLCFEVVKDAATGKPAAFYPVDSGTIRLADPKTRETSGIWFVQFIDGNLYTAYDYDEMAFALRNPTTDIKANGYGISEIEMALNYIAGQIYGEEYNQKFFTQGSTPKGILNIKSANVSQEELDAFRRAWHAQLSGVSNAWKTPIVSSEGGVEWINFSQSNREMEFGRWLEYLVNIICGVYQIDPVEINFPNKGGVSGQSRSLNDSSMIERIKHSKDKGLVPILKFLEQVINKYIVYPLTDNQFEFEFFGYNDLLDSQKLNIENTEVKFLKTVNEVRAQYGFRELEGGDIILDPVFSQYKMQLEMSKIEQGGGQPGEENTGAAPNEESSGSGESEEEVGDEDEEGLSEETSPFGGQYSGQGASDSSHTHSGSASTNHAGGGFQSSMAPTGGFSRSKSSKELLK